MERRIRWLGIFVILCFLVLFLQLNNLQLVQAKKLNSSPGNPRIVLQRYSEPRGTIVSAGGQILAESKPVSNGIYKYQRVYPTGPLFSQVVGYFSYIYGESGVEAAYNKYLVAHQSPITSLGDLLLSNHTVTDDITLTLSSRLQQLAQKELAGRPGAIVVMDPTTGAIRAMYSNPTYNPNPLASPNAATEHQAWLADNTPDSHGFPPLLALAYQRSFPPGSTFKIVTTSAVYEHDPKLINKVYPVRTQIPLPDTTQTLHNYAYEACGGDIAQLLPPSCDTGYAMLGMDLGPKYLSEEAHAFGFDQVPPLDIPGAAASSFPPLSSFKGNEPFVAYSAIGQGNVSATALQMAMVASAIADGGVIMKPHVVQSIHNSQGKLVMSYQPSPWLRPTSQKTAGAIRNLMVAVAQHGTAAGLFPASLHAAAKTGTAQMDTVQHYTTDWLEAFAPANDPKAAVAVMVPYQLESSTGNSVAGPIISTMLQAAVNSAGQG
ncbi:MAG: peptidoglycan D,D-transpeptidase FtsI family protein [Acidimicrobiales bacterium]|jgi:peptidoglycan glycosyltransferase